MEDIGEGCEFAGTNIEEMEGGDEVDVAEIEERREKGGWEGESGDMEGTSDMGGGRSAMEDGMEEDDERVWEGTGKWSGPAAAGLS
jgi:hypothetical protein